jgi:hypothetical protein
VDDLDAALLAGAPPPPNARPGPPPQDRLIARAVARARRRGLQ